MKCYVQAITMQGTERFFEIKAVSPYHAIMKVNNNHWETYKEWPETTDARLIPIEGITYQKLKYNKKCC